MINVLKGTLVAALVMAGLLWWMHSNKEKDKRYERIAAERAERREGAKVRKAIALPNGDGTVYVIESPADADGFEIHTCMLHVRPTTSALGCTPARMAYKLDAE